MPLLSLIIPAFQAEYTLRRAVMSTLQSIRKDELEIIIVDDCSTDATYSVAKELQASYANILVLRTGHNSGGASEPRNLGIQAATGTFLVFLDADDEVVAANLWQMLDAAVGRKADFVKGYYLRKYGNDLQEWNRLPELPVNKEQTIKDLLTWQSTTCDFIVKKSLLEEYKLAYDQNLQVGEDTVFLLSILCVAERPLYIDNYFLIYHRENLWPLVFDDEHPVVDDAVVHATQSWSDREVASQLSAWKTAEELMQSQGLSYYKLRLPVSFRYFLTSLVLNGKTLSQNCFMDLAAFVRSVHKDLISRLQLTRRYQELYDTIYAGDYISFRNVVRKRLLVAGHDLKFFEPVEPFLQADFDIKIDLWTGHDRHDQDKSAKLAAWADYIWCEWLLGNAVYYSRIKNENQRLFIRAHRFEAWAPYGYEVDYSKVNLIFTVNYYYLEQFIRQFSLPRAKVRLLSNFVETGLYQVGPDKDSKFNIGLIGFTPKRKGLLRALSLLKLLLAADSRYNLRLYGRQPQALPWIWDNPAEKDYYQSCEQFIKDNNLTAHVSYGGWQPREQLYKDVGYVLSLSDKERPESFHLATAEAACAGRVIYVLNWPGAEYVYPVAVICQSLEEIKNRILATGRDQELYNGEASRIRDYMRSNYDIRRFIIILKYYLEQLKG